MRKTIYISLMMLFAMFNAEARKSEDKLTISGLRIDATKDTMTVSFSARISPKAVSGCREFVFMPVLTDSSGAYKVSMPAVLVENRQARISRKRSEWKAGVNANMSGLIVSENGSTVNYKASVPVQLWMNRSSLSIESVVSGCGEPAIPGERLLAENITIPLRREPPTITFVEIDKFIPKSVGDTLSLDYSFIVPANRFDADEPYKVYQEDRKTSLIIYFEPGKLTINEGHMSNTETLELLTGAINTIRASNNSDVKHVVVAGFASPEGPFELNDRLAWERAVSVKEYIIKHTTMPSEEIQLFNGSVDWKGLRSFIADDNRMKPEIRKAVLNIIDNTPIWDEERRTGRFSELVRLDNGEPYEYMYREIFPKLRNGAFIKVYYENR